MLYYFKNGGEFMIGAMAITLLAAFLWGITNHIDKFLLNKVDESGSSIKTLLVFSTLVAGIVLTPIWLIISKFLISISLISLISILMSSLVCVLGIYFYFKALENNDASIVVVMFGLRMDQIVIAHLNTIIDKQIILQIITVIWIVGITNAINLIDGLDGLSTGIGIISCFSLLIIFALNGSPLISILLVTSLAGALTGFIPFNFNPAKTFLGDTGSNFLGFALSIIAILGTAKTYTLLVIIAPLFVFAIPLLDTFLAIVRRIIKTKSIKGVFKADSEHLHHKLMKKGYTQKQSVLILYGISATLGMFAIILLESGIYKAISFALIVIAIIAIGYKDILKLREENNEVTK